MEKMFNEIYNSHYSNVLSYCRTRLKGNTEIAEDITSAIFIKIHKSLNSFDPTKSNIKTWIYNVAKNSIIDYYRANKNNNVVSINDFVDDEGNVNLFHTDYSNPQSELENKELGENLNKAINSLPIFYQNIASQFLLQQRSYAEISSDLDLPLGTVKANLHRIREMLKNRLLNL